MCLLSVGRWNMGIVCKRYEYAHGTTLWVSHSGIAAIFLQALMRSLTLRSPAGRPLSSPSTGLRLLRACLPVQHSPPTQPQMSRQLGTLVSLR